MSPHLQVARLSRGLRAAAVSSLSLDLRHDVEDVGAVSFSLEGPLKRP